MEEKKIAITYGNGRIVCPECGNPFDICDSELEDFSLDFLLKSIVVQKICKFCGSLIKITSPARVFDLEVTETQYVLPEEPADVECYDSDEDPCDGCYDNCDGCEHN